VVNIVEKIGLGRHRYLVDKT